MHKSLVTVFLFCLPLTLVGGEKPNFLFVISDDQEHSTVHALGNDVVQTPHIDRLVKRGTAFTHCFVQGSNSGAVCIASRAAINTGKSIHNANYGTPHANGVKLWGEVFREAGYSTFGTGKWHNGAAAFHRSFSHGDNIFFGGMHPKGHLFVELSKYPADGKRVPNREHYGKEYSSKLFADAAVDFLENYREEKPFFMYVAFSAPHDPRDAPKKYRDRYPHDRIPLPPNFLPEHPFDNGEMRIRDEKLAPWPRTPAIVRKEISDYYAIITQMDEQLGRVLDALEKRGDAKNTVIIFTSDHGLAVGQHGLLGKQNLYDHSLRPPMIFVGPGIAAGARNDALVYLHDLFPTTCEMAGLPIPETVESKSFKNLVYGGQGKHYETLYASYRHLHRMARDDRYKLIHYRPSGMVQLFDLQKDPWEMKNLAEDPAHAHIRARLEKALRAWQPKVGDTLDLDKPIGPPTSAGLAPRPGAVNKPDGEGVIALGPETARTRGKLVYQPDRYNLGAWTNRKDIPTWKITVPARKRYAVHFSYGCTNPDVPFTIRVGDASVTGKTTDTTGIKIYKSFRVGELELTAGTYTVSVEPGMFKGAFMNYRGIELRPAK